MLWEADAFGAILAGTPKSFSYRDKSFGRVTAPCPGNYNHVGCCCDMVTCSLYDVQTGQKIGAIGRTS